MALRLIQVHLTVIGKFTNGRRASEQDGRFRISTLADFEGIEVASGDDAADRCTRDPMADDPLE